MKKIRASEGIVPLGEFKARASRILKSLEEARRPLVITKNGRAAAVVLSPRAYDRLLEEEEHLRAVAAGLADAAQGRIVDHGRVVEWLSTWGTEAELEPPE